MTVDGGKQPEVLSERGQVEQEIRRWREIADLVTSQPWNAFESYLRREVDVLGDLMEGAESERLIFQLQGGRRQLKRLLEMRAVCEQQLQELQDAVKELDAASQKEIPWVNQS